MFKLISHYLLINKLRILFDGMKLEDNLEEELVNNLIEGTVKMLFDNLIEYGVKKIRQKAPEWKETFQNWKHKYFY